MCPIKIKQASNGQWYWVLVAANGKVLATSETYTTLAACKKGINAAWLVLGATAPLDFSR